jgi:Flp pilus assembly protein TadG
MRGAVKIADRLLRDRRGSVAQIFAFGFPALAMIAVGAVELSVVASHRQTMQEAADAAALSAAGQLGVAKEGAEERAKAFAMAQVADILSTDAITPEAQLVEGGHGVKVTLSGVRSSFFGNLLPPGGFKTTVSSTAVVMNGAPLCVLASGTKDAMQIGDTGQLKAGGCLVHSNQDLIVDSSAKVVAAMVETSGRASGTISPAAQVGAPPIEDPFAKLATAPPGPCTDSGKVKAERGVTEKIPAGVHCGRWEATKGAILELAPGEHYFAGDDAELKISDDSKLFGKDVVLIFAKKSKLTFQDQAVVDLEGRRTGALAGFLIILDRDNDRTLDIWSDSVDNLLGVIYAPNAKLKVMGKEAVAEDSDWTVVVAKEIELKDAAKLTINSNYSSSLVHTPQGVGPNSLGARLQK